MDKKMEKLLFDMNKVEALMSAIENTYLDVTVVDEDAEIARKGGFAFYALWDAIHSMAADLERLASENE